MRLAPTLPLLLVAAAAPGCAFFQAIGMAPAETDPSAVARDAPAEEPAHVVVQHVLVAFDGSPVPSATRTKDEAKRLADRVLAEAKRGRDFAELVRLYSDDRGEGGKLAMANWGVAPEGDEAERRKMVRAYGALAFALKVGEVGLVPYDENANPLGWFVMRRLK